MEDFISYSKIAELLTKALRDELTDEEREVLERWRHEASVHEAFYRRVNTPEFLEEHPQHRFEGEIAEAWGPPEEACGDKVECGGDGGNCFGRGCFVAVGRGKPTVIANVGAGACGD